MIPDFLENGYLPEGIHEATLEEFVSKFQFSKRRENLIKGLKELINICLQLKINILYIDGSFVTSKISPGDFDACYDTDFEDRDKILESVSKSILESDSETQKEYFGGEIYYAKLRDCTGKYFCILDVFQSCKGNENIKKGIIKIKLNRL